MKRLALFVIGSLITANLVLFVSLYEPKTGDAAAGTSPVRIPAEHGQFTVVASSNGPKVNVNLHDAATADAYYAANRARITSLLAHQRSGDTIEAKVTFRAPVNWEEFIALRDAAGLQPFAYTFAEVAPDGTKWSLDHVAIPDDRLIASAQSDADYAGVRLLGVMVVEGTIPVDSATLGKLADDPRVYAVDTTGVEAARILEQNGIPVQALDNALDIRVPSPYWNFDWGSQS